MIFLSKSYEYDCDGSRSKGNIVEYQSIYIFVRKENILTIYDIYKAKSLIVYLAVLPDLDAQTFVKLFYNSVFNNIS